MRFVAWTSALLALGVAVWSRSAAAGDATIAREQLKIGYALAHDGRCGEALPHFVESVRLDPKAITLINLADCEEKLGRLEASLSHWIDARARARAEGAREIEEEATARALELERRFARLTIVVAEDAPKDAVVERDGVVLGRPSIGVALPIEPGPHRIRVSSRGRATSETTLTLGEGEVRSIEVDAGPRPTTNEATSPSNAVAPHARGSAAAAWRTPAVVAGLGLAAAGVGAGAVTGVLALNAASSARTSCPDLACSPRAWDEIESGRRLGTISTIAFAAAGAGVALGIYGLLTGAAQPDGARARLGWSVGPSGVVVRGRM